MEDEIDFEEKTLGRLMAEAFLTSVAASAGLLTGMLVVGLIGDRLEKRKLKNTKTEPEEK